MSEQMGHFEIHIVDAIRTNLNRRKHYAAVAGWRATLLSILLVMSERLCRPLARRFDRKAKPFNDSGIGIVENDFIDMALIEAVEKPPVYSGVASAAARREVKCIVKRLKRDGLRSLKAGDYEHICAGTASALQQIEALQARENVHYAMTIHLLESLGFAALHAPGYIAADQQTQPLARQLVAIQLRLCDGGLMMDRLAQGCHQRDAGIMINDVPHIPFLRDWQSRG